MRERPMSRVVKERGSERILRAIARHLLPERELAVDRAKPREEQLHDVARADGVGEARMLGARERIRRDAELPNATKALHLRCIDEARDDALFVGLERNEAVHRITKDHARAL